MATARHEGGRAAVEDGPRTAGTIARFLQASLLGRHDGILSSAQRISLAEPVAGGPGIVTTAEFVLADADIAEPRRGVTMVKGE